MKNKPSYEQVVTRLFALLPYYQREGSKAYRPGLDGMKRLCDALANPEQNQVYIHIAGTNGKGSVAHMIASALMAAGYKIGLYTSPHLQDLRERFKVNGQFIEKSWIVDFYLMHESLIAKVRPSFFELTVAMAFQFFKQANTDINVIEVGLGGRLDSTNVILPEISVITNIELEHTKILGDTIGAIASEKAGIIKPHTPVVLGQMREEAVESIKKVAIQRGATIYKADDLVTVSIEHGDQKNRLQLNVDIENERNRKLIIPTLAAYQAENAQTALACLQVLNKRGKFNLPLDKVLTGIQNFQSKTNFRGRFEIIELKPLIIADAMHNPAGASKSIETLRSLGKEVHAVLGFSGDKDIIEILKLFPSNTKYYFCAPKVMRALALDELRALTEMETRGQYFDNSKEALAAARYCAREDHVILIGGSIFLLGELI